MKNSEVADIVRALMKGVITQRHAIKKLEKLMEKEFERGYQCIPMELPAPTTKSMLP